MNGSLHGEHEHLCTLKEALEDCHQFYLEAASESSGDVRRLHETKAHCYATMLVEIEQWQQESADGRTAGPTDPLSPSSRTAPAVAVDARDNDDYFAMLERINHIHDRLFPAVATRDVRADECPPPVKKQRGRRRSA